MRNVGGCFQGRSGKSQRKPEHNGRNRGWLLHSGLSITSEPFLRSSTPSWYRARGRGRRALLRRQPDGSYWSNSCAVCRDREGVPMALRATKVDESPWNTCLELSRDRKGAFDGAVCPRADGGRTTRVGNRSLAVAAPSLTWVARRHPRTRGFQPSGQASRASEKSADLRHRPEAPVRRAGRPSARPLGRPRSRKLQSLVRSVPAPHGRW